MLEGREPANDAKDPSINWQRSKEKHVLCETLSLVFLSLFRSLPLSHCLHMRLSLFSLGAALLPSLALGAEWGSGDRGKVPPGFLTTKGTNFRLDNKNFAFVGSNSYWLPLLTTKADVDLTLKDARKAGIKVMRTWGFNAINATELPTALATDLTYYQVWNGTKFNMNYGKQGLERMDYVVKAAEKAGVKLILAFTNNW
ncbi:hypothetical protein FRC16_010066 [Serendipita sp. 398]|nr:hypothetical protein FRC16_010066 [Serendipita sp. 398]